MIHMKVAKSFSFSFVCSGSTSGFLNLDMPTRGRTVLGRKMSTLCLAFSILSLFTKCTRYRLHNGTEIKSYHPSKGILYRGVWLCYLFSGGIALFSIILSIAYVWRTTTILVWALINVPMINLKIHVITKREFTGSGQEVNLKIILPGKHHKQLLVRYQ